MVIPEVNWNEATDCIVFGCLLQKHGGIPQLVSKLGLGVVNMFCATSFIIIFRYSRKNANDNALWNNITHMTLKLFINEMVFNILPNIAILIVYYVS
ncbi:unnamed protein product [Bursaphelenchus okinawaensis]|uniref:Uncharacterized protein n=1 Tax=Bursaphelenchus okinawaensis TaxID=465554 RepID=A0A811LMH9_9BILA|nr:unnamed protein product [Bursaphelenchus okinawaensis]CAG9127173.1 unnamed protein product [Bursaphelenchus okinawaensis]